MRPAQLHAIERLLPVPLLQPLLNRIVARMIAKHPDVLARMGDKARAAILIDPTDMPFKLLLRPDPVAPEVRILRRSASVRADAAVAAPFMTLLATIDARADSDALFFSRELTVSGDVEAVVRLRNAIDDIDGSVAGDVAEMHGPLGVMILDRLRRRQAGASP